MSQQFRIARALALLLALAAPAAPVARSAHAQAAPAAEAGLETLTIETSTGRQVFKVETMRTESERARGLMHRRYLPADRGMLFDFKVEQPVAFWMKNTYIPLDMIFIDRKGVIVNIAENAEPLSERSVPSAAPVLGVLEINGGLSRKLGVRPGDRVGHPMFGR